MKRRLHMWFSLGGGANNRMVSGWPAVRKLIGLINTSALIAND